MNILLGPTWYYGMQLWLRNVSRMFQRYAYIIGMQTRTTFCYLLLRSTCACARAFAFECLKPLRTCSNFSSIIVGRFIFLVYFLSFHLLSVLLRAPPYNMSFRRNVTEQLTCPLLYFTAPPTLELRSDTGI